MQSIIFFTACSGNSYELVVEHEPGCDIPKGISESRDGVIREADGGRKWDGLTDMTHDLRAEIKRWGSDVGD